MGAGASGRDPVADFTTILDELQRFSPEVAAKPQIVAANKMDAVDDPDRVKALERQVKKLKLRFLKISGATGEGIDALLEAIWKEVAGQVRLKADTTSTANTTSTAHTTSTADKTGSVTKPDTAGEHDSVDLIGAARRSARLRKA